ncbi:MAG: hypothetical protein MZV65_01115 [Chromatiales bacterium]|nr:hypothetical protein [Chromatiales bacterium]
MADKWKHGVRRAGQRAPLPGRRRGRRPRRRAQDAPRQRCNAGVLTSVGRRRDRQVGLRAAASRWSTTPTRRSTRVLDEDAAAARGSARRPKGFVVLELGRRRLGALLHEDAGRDARRPARSSSCSPGRATPKPVEIWKSAGFNPVPLPSTEIADRAPDRPRSRRLDAPPQVAVISQYYKQREEHDGPEVGAAARARRSSTRSTWDEDPRRRQAGAPRGAAGGGRAAPGRRSGDAESSDVAAMKKRGLTVVAGRRARRSELWRTDGRERPTRGSAATIVPADGVRRGAAGPRRVPREDGGRGAGRGADDVEAPWRLRRPASRVAARARRSCLARRRRPARSIDAVGRPLGGFHVPGAGRLPPAAHALARVRRRPASRRARAST